MMSRIRRVLAVAGALALGVGGCGDDSADTGAVVTVGAEMAVRDATTEVVVTVVGAKGDGTDSIERERRFAGSELTFPLKVGVTPHGGDASRVFGVLAVARDGSGAVVAHASVVSTYVGGKVAWYHLQLRSSCDASVSCEPLADGTPTGCCDGTCVPILRGPGAQPAWEGAPSSVPSSARVCEGEVPPMDAGTDAGDAGTDAGDAGIVEPFDAETIVAAHPIGGEHTCARSAAGRVMCWGKNEEGQLGDGTRTMRSTPVDVQLDAAAAQIALGTAHVCALDTDGGVLCWGQNDRGQLGTSGAGSSMPVRVEGITADVTHVGVGSGHSCAVLSGGDIECWGRNDRGQLGDGTVSDRSEPVRVDSSESFVEVCGGNRFTCARTMEGAVLCWGDNSRGQVGDGTGGELEDKSETPVQVSFTGTDAATQLDCGGGHACALREDDTVHCWGANGQGQLGDGTNDDRLTPVELQNLPTGPSPMQVEAGGAHTCVRMSDGDVQCVGGNINGQLGDGTIAGKTQPVAVAGLSGATDVATGGNWSCAVTDGQAFCWGANRQGQLGDGTTSGSLEPSAVQLP